MTRGEQPNPYTYPCFVLKETICDQVVTSSERHNFSDLQLAYLWAKGDTGLDLDPNIREGRIGNWSYTSFDRLRDWITEDPISGYRVFKRRYDSEYYTEYLIYYDIPSEELPSQQVQVVLPSQLTNGVHVNSGSVPAITNEQQEMINNIVNNLVHALGGQPNQIHIAH